MTGPRIINSDCREAMAAMDADSVDSIVCDPPYGLSFMGKGWDHGVPGVEFWQAALRVAKPGAYLLAFGGTRTFHRLMVAIEDAGWELRDTIGWIYGSGFPKSLDVSKAIDKVGGYKGWALFRSELAKAIEAAGLSFADIDRALGVQSTSCYWVRTDHRACFPAKHHWVVLSELLNLSADLEALHGEAEREILAVGKPKGKSRGVYGDFATDEYNYTAPATDAAKQWEGWGTALKPAWEPIVVARKPLVGTVAENVLRHGTGGMNIDGCRVAGNLDEMRGRSGTSATPGGDTTSYRAHNANGGVWDPSDLGRWPANIITDGSEEVIAMFPASSVTGRRSARSKGAPVEGTTWGTDNHLSTEYTDTGSAARFFYQAKASKADRNEGLPEGAANNHPTVKPSALMRYLCRLVTPLGGLVLDPFCGSGSTGKAAVLEGFRFVGVEQDPAYVEIARARILAAVGVDAPAAAGRRQIGLFGGAA